MTSTVEHLSADQKLARINVKIERAKKHILDLDSALKAFNDASPYERVPQYDSHTGKLVSVTVTHVAPIPDCISTIFGDAIQNLRSALDHLAHQLWMMTPGADPDRHVNFPFFNTPSQFKTFIKGAIECFRQDAVNAILATQPYKGGKGHQLWVLNRLNNIDKHRLLLVAQSGWYDDINLAALLAQSNEGLTVPKGLEKKLYLRRPAPSICPLKAGDVLAIRPEHAAMDYELQLRFEVSLHEPHVVESKPILKTAQDFADLVRSTVAAFKPCLS